MKASNNQWWRGGVIYQVYPRSFADSNGDGIGDLPGITARLEHIASLGVDAVWLSPFFKSPMKDFGYDVSDYNDVDPMFGTLDDFKQLVDRAHALGLKVMIDQVLVAHLGPAPVVRREPRAAGQPARRLVRLGRCKKRRHAAEQLAQRVRRQLRGSGIPRAASTTCTTSWPASPT